MKPGALLLTSLAVAGLVAVGWLALRSGAEAAPARVKPEQLTAAGTLLRQGRPFFPIGIYQPQHTDEEYALLAAQGFNAITGHFTTDVGQFIETLDLAQRHHLAVTVPLYAGNLVKENLDKSLAKIRAAAMHPAVLAWKICDEPDAKANAHLRSDVAPAFRAIKALHPTQPVELTLSKDETLGAWTPFCDLVEIDRYPVPDRPLTDVLDFCRRTRREMEPWQNLTFVVQCGWTKDLRTQPSFEQARAMVFLALIGGAKGIFWYSRQETNGWDLTTTPLWPRLREINAELAALAEPVLLGVDLPGIACSAATVCFAGKQHDGRLYLLATNPTATPVEAVFTLPTTTTARVASLAGQPLPLQDRTVRVPLTSNAAVTIIFDLQ
ncbi:MAG: hypothetical protein K8R23_04035 [Chthoniobacter sp.]|nr:hypothetical protein [Chthoniobacter sp.]